MILFPAIDLKDGKCVRLLKGDMSTATVFSDDPAGQAAAFEEAGCEWLHLVDLDGAVEGRSANTASVAAIVSATNLSIQLGGGIRNFSQLEAWLNKGVSRVVLGTAAVENSDLVDAAAREFPNRIAVGIDSRGGFVATRGWLKDSTTTAIEVARRFEDSGIAAIIYTDIDRDGAMKGPNIRKTADLANSVSVPVVASGGVSSLQDLAALRDCNAPLAGAICGRAIYDNRFSVEEALALLSSTGEAVEEQPIEAGEPC